MSNTEQNGTSAPLSKKRRGLPKAVPPPDNPRLRAQAHLVELRAADTPEAMVAATRGVATADTEAAPDLRRIAELRYKALRQSRQAQATTARAPVVPGRSNWVQLGPLVIPNGQTYGTARVNVTGRITSIAVDPTNPQIIYVGAAQGGVWKTTNGGNHWRPLTDNQGSLSIGALSIDPNDPQVIYAGTGEANFSLDSYYGIGVLKSIDGGESWQELGKELFFGAAFARILVHPTQPATLFAATGIPGGARNDGGLYRSLDGGTTWRLLRGNLPATATGATDLVIDPTNPDVVYVAFWRNGVFKSNNATAATPTWTKLTGLPGSGVTRIALALAPSTPTTLYALLSSSNDQIEHFYQSNDGGTSWSQISLPLDPETETRHIGGQGFYNLYLAVDPTTADVVYLCGVSVWKAVRDPSTNRWFITEIGRNIHSDNHVLVFDPTNAQTLYVGNDGGIYQSTNGGRTWSDRINRELCITQFEFIDHHPTTDTVVIGGTQDNGTEIYRNSPVFYHADEGDGGYTAVDPIDPRIMYHGYYNAEPLTRSTTGGKWGQWKSISKVSQRGVGLFYSPFALDQSDPNNVALGNGVVDIYQRRGTIGSWIASIPLPGLAAQEFVSALTFVNSTLIYAATELGKVYRLTKGAQGWQARRIDGDVLPRDFIWDIATPPTDPQTVLVAMSGFDHPHLWLGAGTAAGTVNWSNSSGAGAAALPNIPINALVIDPATPTTLYVGTDIGVYRSVDNGNRWSLFSDGLPNCAIFDLRLHGPARLLRAATHGRGLWELQLDAETQPLVRLFVRKHLLDSGRNLPVDEIDAAFEDVGRQIRLGDRLTTQQCADIKVDAPSLLTQRYQMALTEVDYASFEAKLQHRLPRPGKVNRLYVQVHNRGILPARNVTVKVLHCAAGATLPALPSDFWSTFPADATAASPWQPVGPAQTIAALSPVEPTVLAWEWPLPANAPAQQSLLVVIDCADDPIPPAGKVLNVDELLQRVRQVGVKR